MSPGRRPRVAVRQDDLLSQLHAVAAAALRWTLVPDEAEADVVAVTSPPSAHVADALTALERGAAVLVEPPLALTLADADRLVAIAGDHDERLLYGEAALSAPVIQELLVQVPSLGRLAHLEVRALAPRPTWRTSDPEDWGGGALVDLAVHALAVAALVGHQAGAGPLVGVAARLDGPDGDVDDESELRLRFSDGTQATVLGSWRGASAPLWDVQAASETGVLRAELHPRPELTRDGEAVTVIDPGTDPPQIGWYGYLGQLASFERDLRERRRPVTDAAFGQWILEVLCAAATSAGRDGAEEPLPYRGPRDRRLDQLWRAGSA